MALHVLLIAKVAKMGCSDHPGNGMSFTKAITVHASWMVSISVVPQRTILSPLLFLIFIKIGSAALSCADDA